jgi:ATP-dependent metalloprotease
MGFVQGVMTTAKKGVDWVANSQWLSWWPFLSEQRLQRLIEDADANPRDAAKQSILLAELNKRRFSLVYFSFH